MWSRHPVRPSVRSTARPLWAKGARMFPSLGLDADLETLVDALDHLEEARHEQPAAHEREAASLLLGEVDVDLVRAGHLHAKKADLRDEALFSIRLRPYLGSDFQGLR